MRDPAVETLPWEAQAAADDAAYRAQVAYLFDRSRFYRDKLAAAGFPDAASVGGLDRVAALPFTEKDELRASRTAELPIGTHLAAPMAEVARIYSTSGTTGTPSYIPLTRDDLAAWIAISSPLLCRLRDPPRRPAGLDLRRRTLRRRRRRSTPSQRSGSAISRSAPATPSG